MFAANPLKIWIRGSERRRKGRLGETKTLMKMQNEMGAKARPPEDKSESVLKGRHHRVWSKSPLSCRPDFFSPIPSPSADAMS